MKKNDSFVADAYMLSVEQVARTLSTSPKGLSATQAAARFAQYGSNSLQVAKSESF